MDTALTVTELLGAIKQIAPLLSGMWALLSVLLGAAIVGAIWVTRISLAVKENTAKLKTHSNISDKQCEAHRMECDKRHAIEFTSVASTLIEIKESINKINERHERYQEALLRGARNGN